MAAFCCNIFKLKISGLVQAVAFPMPHRNIDRAVHVRSLNKIAKAKGISVLPDNAARARVEALAEQLLQCDQDPSHQVAVHAAKTAYLATFPGECAGGSAGEPERPPDRGRVWKFQAVQLTYNCSAGEWTSTDVDVLRKLFDRFVAFMQSVACALGAVGMSATMERASQQQVHTHSYMHFLKPFHRREPDALDMFKFEGIPPHLTPNTASGKSFAGAVRYGHFYVVVDKIGSLSLS